MKHVTHVLFFFLIAALSTALAQTLVVHPVPQELVYSAHNDDFTVRVRRSGEAWQDLFEYAVDVDMDKVQIASMVTFDFSGTVEVAVTANNETIQAVQIRPLSAEIVPTLRGKTLYFKLNQPRNLSIEINGDKRHNLHLFANPLETYKPNPNDPNIVYFGPGIHTPGDKPGDVFNIPSDKTVYLAGGAVLRGKLVCDKVKNVRILGRGILDHPLRGIEITHSENVEVDGLIVRNPQHYTVYGGQSKGITIRNLKSFSCKGWSDGIDLMSCSDVLVDNVFMRNSDDCIALYGHRWNYYGSCRNVTVKNSILWADVAHPINLGLHGNTVSVGDTLENITFTNIDILEHDEDDPNYQGCMAISCGDLNLIRNIRFENIRVDDFEEGQLVNLRVLYNQKYNTGPGRNIEDVLFKNITYTGALANPSIIEGLSEKGAIKGVTFDNISINGKQILSTTDFGLKVGRFTEAIKFTPVSATLK
ncbi:glycoside hydrolase [Spirosoma sp. HMF4905]|uniref:Glycoside hydrolase n=1 Tax=Spirosoma arboris TaxID=2682092 RepID=A0A7K1SQC5_9BACT|nr:glycosyl hydrolase family 28 protein [Spirosoma arboris]MVM35991.1 glycoside hydrolase [Spirosoma arboris]